MFKSQNPESQASIVSWFCDPFAAVAAVRQLTAIGLSESELDLVGFLNGNLPDWNPLLTSLGLSTAHADYYREEFEDGVIMLVIHASDQSPKRSFVKVLKQHGGFVPEEEQTLEKNRGRYESQ